MTRLILLLNLSILFRLSAHQSKFTLQEALDKKLVKVEVKSLGTYQGYCMELTIHNLTKSTAEFIIEAGRRLNSVEEEFQDILIVKQEQMNLKANEKKTIQVKGYCCQAANRCPNTKSIYGINKMADSSLIKLARYLSDNEFGQEEEQEAVWAISEGRSAANIATKDDSLVQPLRMYVASLKGEILPWYRVVSQKTLSRSNYITSVPVLLRGEIAYNVTEPTYITLSIKDETGLEVGIIKSQWVLPKNNAVYQVDLPLVQLSKGKYKIELESKDLVIAEKQFEL